jgi:Anti-sigma factor NepR
MQQSNNHQWAKQIPDSLKFSQEQVTFILGHALRSQYQDLLASELPDRLQALVEQLEKKHASSSGTP